ncbi:hypothetical protein AB4Z34_08245 [Ensifer sp. 2YAB10]|jgi:hypothetical protein|nr:hypothetical protein [Ensifer sp. SSB1]
MAPSLEENIAWLTSIMTAFDLQQNPARCGMERENDRPFHYEMAWQTYCVAPDMLTDIFRLASNVPAAGANVFTRPDTRQ